ncbi:acyltransferase [Betaproteobacteria bacterium]|nr:acyltransferase [Betaproteobacteria bacterium]
MLIDFLFRLLARLPLAWLHALGGVVGWLVWRLSPRYRHHFRANLEQALGTIDPAVLRQAILEAGRASFELPWLWLRPLDEVLVQVKTVHGWEAVDAALRDGAGILFITPHLGCFEITAQYCAHAAGKPLVVLYRPPRYRALEPLMQAGRVRGLVTTAPADFSGVRQLLKTLRTHGMVGMLPDQVPGEGEGVWVDFFGRPAWTMTLGARLAEVRGVRTFYIWAERLPRGQGYALHYAPPVEEAVGDLSARCAAMNREVERLIRQCPQQYLWGYNRYKRPRHARDEAPDNEKTSET